MTGFTRFQPTEDRVDAARIVDAVRQTLGTTGSVALHEPEFTGNEWAYVKDCIQSTWVSSVGRYVDQFEGLLREVTGAQYAVATVNGTAALHVAILLAGVKPGDEVLMPALTFIATANAVRYANATPHLVDSSEETLGLDPDAVAAYLADIAEMRNGVCTNKATGAPIRAIIPMHTFGLPVAMDRLLEVAAEWKLIIVEDAAEALGSYYRGRHCGTFGKIGTLSFNGNKVVTTGGGGAILTDDARLGAMAKHLTTTARVGHRWSFIHDQIGYNYRMPNINAALGCAQLERLQEKVDRKRALVAQYATAFASLAGCRIVQEQADCHSSYWLTALVLNESDLHFRDDVLNQLNEAGFMSRPVWALMHHLPMFTDCPRMSLQVAESLENRIINLPSSPQLAGIK